MVPCGRDPLAGGTTVASLSSFQRPTCAPSEGTVRSCFEVATHSEQGPCAVRAEVLQQPWCLEHHLVVVGARRLRRGRHATRPRYVPLPRRPRFCFLLLVCCGGTAFLPSASLFLPTSGHFCCRKCRLVLPCFVPVLRRICFESTGQPLWSAEQPWQRNCNVFLCAFLVCHQCFLDVLKIT